MVSGHTAALEALRSELSQELDASIVEMPIEFGLHSSIMDPIIQQFAMYLEKVDFKDMLTPLINGIDAATLNYGDQIRLRVIEHMHNAIAWHKVLAELEQFDVVVEVGPGSQLSSMVKAKYPDKLVATINKRSDVDELKKIVG